MCSEKSGDCSKARDGGRGDMVGWLRSLLGGGWRRRIRDSFVPPKLPPLPRPPTQKSRKMGQKVAMKQMGKRKRRKCCKKVFFSFFFLSLSGESWQFLQKLLSSRALFSHRIPLSLCNSIRYLGHTYHILYHTKKDEDIANLVLGPSPIKLH